MPAKNSTRASPPSIHWENKDSQGGRGSAQCAERSGTSAGLYSTCRTRVLRCRGIGCEVVFLRLEDLLRTGLADALLAAVAPAPEPRRAIAMPRD